MHSVRKGPVSGQSKEWVSPKLSGGGSILRISANQLLLLSLFNGVSARTLESTEGGTHLPSHLTSSPGEWEGAACTAKPDSCVNTIECE